MSSDQDPAARNTVARNPIARNTVARMAASGATRFAWDIPVAGLLVAIALAVVGAVPAMIPLLYLAAVTVPLAASDLAEHRLPNRLVAPGYLACVAAAAAEWVHTGTPPVVALVSGAAYFGFLLVFAIAGGMGMGDVKLAGVLGFAAGLVGPAAAVASPVLAFVLGGMWSVVALATGRRGIRIPFGPFLLAGLWLAVLVAAG